MTLEWLAVLAVFLLGLAPLLNLLGGAGSRRSAWRAAAAGTVLALAAAGLLLPSRRLVRSTPPADIPLEAHDGGYVSSGSCRACHPQQYDSWRRSFHRTMTRLATPEYVKGDFGVGTVAAKGLLYRLERRGDEYWVETPEFWKPAPADRPPQRVWRRLEMLTGSHHMQVYWFATGEGRKLEQLPILYLFEARRWIPREAAFLMPPAEGVRLETGRWNDTCISCHATRGQPRLMDDGPIDSHVAELGIACEACHGPGLEHVRDNQDPLRRYRRHFRGGAQKTIAHPARFDAARSSQVCGQCHSVAVMRGADFTRWKIEGSSYRPGSNLEEMYPALQYSRPDSIRFFQEQMPDFLGNRFWADGTVRVSGREYNGLIESPCFAGEGMQKLACLSCHTMHQDPDDGRASASWTDDQLVPGMEGDRACLQCHASRAGRAAPIQNVAAHTHHAAASSGSRCYNCHMPYTTYGLLKAIRSHRVGSPTVQESLATGRPNACNQCHLDRTLDWAAGFLHDWYGTERPALSADQRTIPSGALWALKGDAGQRALAAWSMGWDPAREASGSRWQAVYLAPLLNDPYDAVRYIAQRSLKSLPGFERWDYDFMAPRVERAAEVQRVVERWRRADAETPGSDRDRQAETRRQVVLSQSELLRLLGERDERTVDLKE